MMVSSPVPIFSEALHSSPLPLTLKFKGELKKGEVIDRSAKNAKITPNRPHTIPKDPLPKWGLRNLKYMLFALLALTGGKTSLNIIDETLYQPAAYHHSLSSQVSLSTQKLGRHTLAALLTLLFTGSFYAGLRKVIRPSELFAELHQEGITGKGITVGLIDGGYRGHLLKDITFYHGDDLSTPGKPISPKSEDGHADSTLAIIEDGSPDSLLILIDIESKSKNKIEAQEESDLSRYWEEILKAPLSLNLDKLEEYYDKEIIDVNKSKAKEVEKLLAEGSQVINISIGEIGNSIFIELDNKLKSEIKRLKALKLTGIKTKLFEKNLAEIIHLQAIIKEAKIRFNRRDKLIKLTEPWFQALDKAHEKGAVVVVGAGNSGRQPLNPESHQTHIYELINHSALITVGSTNINGKVSPFTSEWTNRISPFNGAYGDYQILTKGVHFHNENRLSKELGVLFSQTDFLRYVDTLTATAKALVLWPLKKTISLSAGDIYAGTSCAAPIESVVCTLMKSVDPNRRIDGPLIKQAIANTTTEAYFEPAEKKAVRKELMKELGLSEDRPLNDDETEQLEKALERAIRRRVGHGKLNGVAAVHELKRLLAEEDKNKQNSFLK